MILHWNYRNLSEIPSELLQNGDHVKEIYMKRNNLTSLPKDIGKLANLSNLYLIGNKISTLPWEIYQLPLVLLDVSQNLLQTIPSSIGKMKGLQQLLLTQNQITSLPKELGQLKFLKFLELSGNMLTSLSEVIIQGLTSLEELAIDGNPISYFPRFITTLQNLHYVSACKCNLLYLPAMPFYQLVNGKRADGNFTPSNTSPQADDEDRLSNFQFLFDSNPNLNYLPFWVLQILGQDLESFGCGFRTSKKPSAAGNQSHSNGQNVPIHTIDRPIRSIYQNYHGVKIHLDHPWTKDHILCFDQDLMKIYNETANQPLSLFEECLRVVHTENLHKNPHQNWNRRQLTIPVVEPHLKYSSRSNVKDMSAYSSASDTLYSHDPLPAVPSSSSAMEIDGSTQTSNIDQNIETPKPPQPPPLLPLNLGKTLDQNVVARCFSCMRPIFTETWLMVLGFPSNLKIYLRRRRNNNPPEVEDQRLVQNENNELTISCIFCCSKRCRDKLNTDFLKHDIKFSTIK